MEKKPLQALKRGNQTPSFSNKKSSPSGSPGASKLFQSGVVSQRHRSFQQTRKPPEPLRRAVADCLSSSQHGIPSPATSEAARTLRDYLAAPSTVDMAYNVLLEHALAERERSPAVVAKCVALLKRYLIRYIPKVDTTLQQIDLFCVNSISEGDSFANRTASPWLRSASQQSGPSLTSGTAFSSLPTSTFSSEVLKKSLTYVRALVARAARHIPRQSFQPVVFAGASNASKQPLSIFSSLVSRSFNSQLSPGVLSSRESPESKEISTATAINSSNLEGIDEEDFRYIAVDVVKWRWPGDTEQLLRMPSAVKTESDAVLGPHSFLEVGAAALLVGDTELKMKNYPGKSLNSRLTPDVDLEQLFQPSTLTTAADFTSARSHLRAITASKRMKADPHQVWEDVPVSTFRARSRPLFQYRHYSEQQPLRLNPAEVCAVIAAVCLENCAMNVNPVPGTSRLTNHNGRPSMDAAFSVLIKLIIDMYVVDPQSAAPLMLSMLEDMLRSSRLASRVRAFDLILNLGVHAHLLEPIFNEDSPTIEEEESSQEQDFSGGEQFGTLVKRDAKSSMHQNTSAIGRFESWILSILYEILLLLVQTEEREETVWASALSCLLYLLCDRGKIWRNRLEGLDIRVIKVLLEISREHSWAEVLHSKLIYMLTNMFYQAPGGSTGAISVAPIFSVEQVDLLGGIEFICSEYSRANTVEEKRNLFMVLFDYVLHQLNETCLAIGSSAYTYDEILPLARMLILADAPEAFFIAVKHGMEGIGGVLRGSISSALSRHPNSEHLNTLLESITSKFDAIISIVTHSDGEFSDMIHMTKSYKSFKNIEDGSGDVVKKLKLSLATLHSLLHSERSAYRQNGYIWLVELLESEISGEREKGIWSNIKKLQQRIEIAGRQDSSSEPSVPFPIWVFCGLLKSKHNFIRRGFLFVLEKLLMRCQILLDENELQHMANGEVSASDGNNRLEKANAVIDIMSSALYLVFSTTETDRINILKMCNVLFSQLCLRVHPISSTNSNVSPIGDPTFPSDLFGNTDQNHEVDKIPCELQHKEKQYIETSSMAALFLRGYASIPVQLIARVPTALFYWPLIQLAGAATDDIALGVAVGSKGRGNLPGAASDIRAALLLLLIGKCLADPDAFFGVGGELFFRGLLDDTDARVAYYASAFLLKRMMTEEPEKYQNMLHNLVFKAQQSNNEKLLENPYLQMRGILQLSNDLGTPI